MNIKEFFTKYNIDEKEFIETELEWDDLMKIYDEYNEFIDELREIASSLTKILMYCPEVHSVRSRVKNSEHLVEKIIRKKIADKDREITINNYKEEITDLIGLRILYLHKEQVLSIDEYIRDNWELNEPTTIYYRKGDFIDEYLKLETEEKMGYITKEHEAGYRSWHYLISAALVKRSWSVEIQVRTIFEEGWSEIDHQLRYPYSLENELLNDQLLVLNRLAGSADELINVIKNNTDYFIKLHTENDNNEKIITNLKNEIDKLKDDEKIKDEVHAKLERELNQYKTPRNQYVSFLNSNDNSFKTDSVKTFQRDLVINKDLWRNNFNVEDFLLKNRNND